MISPIRVHTPDSCHGWGIEFNYSREFWEADATNFVKAVKKAIRDNNLTKWFHQYGSASQYGISYFGYQFFETWSNTAEEDAKEMAIEIAKKLNTIVEES